MTYFDFSWQVAGLVALALLTPSTGFILDSLQSLGLDEQEQFWVTSKAIVGELLALLLLFLILKSDSYVELAMSSGVLLATAVGLPLVLIFLGRIVIPHVPGSEFSLLVMVGLISAYLTKQIGVYYLVGAFLQWHESSRSRPAMAVACAWFEHDCSGTATKSRDRHIAKSDRAQGQRIKQFPGSHRTKGIALDVDA